MKFIELTLSNDDSKFLANVGLVTEIYDHKEKGSRLYFANGNADCQSYINVKESYEDVKALIKAV